MKVIEFLVITFVTAVLLYFFYMNLMVVGKYFDTYFTWFFPYFFLFIVVVGSIQIIRQHFRPKYP